MRHKRKGFVRLREKVHRSLHDFRTRDRASSEEVKEAGGEVLRFVFRPPSREIRGGIVRGTGGPVAAEGLHPTRLKVKREFLFESLLIFKPTQLKRAARPV